MSRYLDPKADIVFKRIFGDHPHLLKNFLNAILPLADDEQIVTLHYLPTEQVPKIPIFKHSIVDVKCTDTQGRVFIVEMQMEWTTGFVQRMLFNSAQAYVKQISASEDYKFICPVYGLGLINSNFDKSPDWYHHYQIVHSKYPEKQLKGLEFVFLELKKFKPSSQEEKQLRKLWIRFLSEIGTKTEMIDAELLAIPEIEEACALCEEAAYSKAELAAYESYWDHVRTEKTLMSGSREEGKQEGIEIGRRAEKIETAKQLLSLNFDLSGIAAVTKLSIAELEEIQDQLSVAETLH